MSSLVLRGSTLAGAFTQTGIAHGDAVVTNAFGGGAGTSVAPTIYDDFTTGTLNASIADFANATVGQWSANTHGRPTYSNAQIRGAHTRTAKHNFPADEVFGAVALCKDIGMSTGQSAYFDFWSKNLSTVPGSVGDNWKILRWYGTGAGGDSEPQMNWVYLGTGGGDLACIPQSLSCGLDGTPFYNNSVTYPYNVWRHYQLVVRLNSNIANDLFLGYVDHVQRWNKSGGARCSNTNTFQDWRMGYYQHDPFSVIHTSCAYMSFSEKRVEWGNNATYGNCTVREIQPHTSWADGSITYTANKGQLTSGTNFEFIVLTGFTPFASRSITVV